MADISMCLNRACPLRMDCYRYTAKPSLLQAYSNFQFEFGEDDDTHDTVVFCEFFWDNKGFENVREEI